MCTFECMPVCARVSCGVIWMLSQHCREFLKNIAQFTLGEIQIVAQAIAKVPEAPPLAKFQQNKTSQIVVSKV